MDELYDAFSRGVVRGMLRTIGFEAEAHEVDKCKIRFGGFEGAQRVYTVGEWQVTFRMAFNTHLVGCALAAVRTQNHSVNQERFFNSFRFAAGS
jgi:hypothetical protein